MRPEEYHKVTLKVIHRRNPFAQALAKPMFRSKLKRSKKVYSRKNVKMD